MRPGAPASGPVDATISDAGAPHAGGGGSGDGGGLETCPPPPASYGASLEAVWSRRALCLCEGAALSGGLSVRGGLGVDLDLDANAPVSVEGPASVVGRARLGPFEARLGALAVGGSWSGEGALVVLGDAVVGGDLRAAALTVGGRLIQAPGARLEVAGPVSAPRREAAPVEVSPPCGCDRLPDPDAFLQGGEGRASSDLADVQGQRAQRLGCGVHRFDRWGGGGDVELWVDAPARVVIEQGIALRTLEVRVAAGARLDLLVGGEVAVGERLLVEPVEPVEDGAAIRVVLSGRGSLGLPEGARVVAEVYAPWVEVVAPAGGEVHGSAIARRLSASAPIDFSR